MIGKEVHDRYVLLSLVTERHVARIANRTVCGWSHSQTSRAWRMDAEDIYSNSLSMLGLWLQCIDEHDVNVAEV